MSIALYAVRLWWDGRRGQARYHGEPVTLAICPDLGLRIDAVDYAPSIGCKLIMPHAWRWRDMDAAEEGRVLDYLRGMT